ncbi:MAG: hypothetical protein ACPGJE_04315, partial [Wenzhouxiangellaceae bacterium]
RGDSWTRISDDLTRDQERFRLEVMGRTWSYDAPWDTLAMSNYNTITSLAESPVEEGLLYAGTDDGLIQVSENGGERWRRIEVGDLPGVPDTAFVNDIKADLFDADTVYVALDNHKYGDFKPYLLKSTDRGRRWRSIAGDLPDRHLVWRVVQDHVRPGLMFAATEFGLFVTLDGGGDWAQLKGNAPTISFRDLVIQRRENDLVGASFGRGFWILDDYSALREIDADTLTAEATLFDTRDAWWYMQKTPLGNNDRGSQGHGLYLAENPPFGAVFTYHLSDGYKTLEQQRQEREKPRIREREDVEFPDWVTIETEQRQPDPAVLLIVRDADGNVVRRLEGPSAKGMHRVAWDLRMPSSNAVGAGGGFGPPAGGFMVVPGTYRVELAKRIDGEVTPLADPREFEVVRMRTGALDGAEPEATVAFWKRLADLQRRTTAANQIIGEARERIDAMSDALKRSTAPAGELDSQLYAVSQRLYQIVEQLRGRESMDELSEPQNTIGQRIFVAQIGTSRSTYGPTPTHEMSLDIAEREFADVADELNRMMQSRIPALERALREAGAPWTPGAPLPAMN